MEKCCMRANPLDENMLMSSQFFAINGTRGHRICIDCRSTTFAIENIKFIFTEIQNTK